MKGIAIFHNSLRLYGSDLIFHREDGGTTCPCVSPEGYRSPVWHKANPEEPVCNEDGKLSPTVTNLLVKGHCQPVQAGAVRRLTTEVVRQLWGEVQMDDHLGFLPCEWNGSAISFDGWSDSGADYIIYDNRRFTVVSVNKIADPLDGDPDHHYEVGLRLIKSERPTD